MATGTKKKVHARFTYPFSIDMGPYCETTLEASLSRPL